MSECIAARSHQEAVDLLIERKARIFMEVYEGYLDDTDAQMLIYDPEWLGLNDQWGNQAEEITAWELGMPTVPGIADLNNRRKIALDVEGSLKRQGVIDPDFSLDECADDQDAKG